MFADSDCSSTCASSNESEHSESCLKACTISQSPKELPKVAGSSLLQRRAGKTKNLKPLMVIQNKDLEKSQDPVAEQFDIVKVLGAGSFGSVREAIRKADGERFALKTFGKSDDHAAAAQKEFRLLSRLSHPKVVRAHALLAPGPRCATIVLELIAGGSLAEAVRARAEGRLAEETARQLSRDVLEAVGHCHENRIVHRDIKPENVLVTTSLTQAKLADFNSACDLEDSTPLTPTGTRLYSAPEVLLCQAAPSESSDVWSVGLCMYFMLSGSLPQDRHKSHRSTESMADVAAKPVKMDDHQVWKEVSAPCKAVLQHCLALESTQRPSPMAALQHEWFQPVSDSAIIEHEKRPPSAFASPVSDI